MARIGRSPAARRNVLLVSPTAPPVGGMQTWTEIALERGLPAPFAFELVDTRAAVRHQKVARRPPAAQLARLARILRDVARALRSGRFALVHFNCSFTPRATPRNLLATALARAWRVPYVIHLHGTFAPPTGARCAERLYRWAWRRVFAGAGAVLALGAPSRRGVLALGDFGAKTVGLMPNFVDWDRVPARPAHWAREGPLRVVYAGTLVAAKGAFAVLDIAERLPGVRFLLIGDAAPAARAALAAAIGRSGLGDRVELAGPMARAWVLERLADCDVFLLPSASEGFPFAVAEAMAVGLPVVASSVGAIPEMVDEPAGGYLLAPDDAAGFAAALGRLRDPAPRRRMGRHNRAKARREYEYGAVARRLCAVYERVAQDGGGNAAREGPRGRPGAQAAAVGAMTVACRAPGSPTVRRWRLPGDWWPERPRSSWCNCPRRGGWGSCARRGSCGANRGLAGCGGCCRRRRWRRRSAS